MGEEKADYPPEDFKGSSWCDKDGCFNRQEDSDSYNWTNNEGKDMGTYSPEKEKTHAKFAKGFGAVLGMDPSKMSDPKEGPKQALNAASTIINVLSFAEGGATIKGATILGKVITGYGMANDANDLFDTWTNVNGVEHIVGDNGAAANSIINSGTGIAQSVINKQPTIGNMGDVKDLITTFSNYFVR